MTDERILTPDEQIEVYHRENGCPDNCPYPAHRGEHVCGGIDPLLGCEKPGHDEAVDSLQVLQDLVEVHRDHADWIAVSALEVAVSAVEALP